MKFNFEATGIGSVPFKDPSYACRIICETFTDIPFWPQLPKRSYLEHMYVQFSERLPGLVLGTDKGSAYIDTGRVAGEIEEVYGKYVEADLEFFGISPEYAAGLYEFLKFLEAKPSGDVTCVKGHTTGPISFALSMTDQNKHSLIYDKDLFDIITKVLAMRARWQVRKLKKYVPNVILFIDEPYLVSIGSSIVNIPVGPAFEKFSEVVAAAKLEKAIVGVHCCGNTDWSLLLKSDVDIINFDAYNFMKEFSLYAEEIKNFIKRGGTIAWGMVPSSDAIMSETKLKLIDRHHAGLKLLSDKGIAVDDISSIVTSSCGLGTLSENTALKVLEGVGKVSKELKNLG